MSISKTISAISQPPHFPNQMLSENLPPKKRFTTAPQTRSASNLRFDCADDCAPTLHRFTFHGKLDTHRHKLNPQHRPHVTWVQVPHQLRYLGVQNMLSWQCRRALSASQRSGLNGLVTYHVASTTRDSAALV
ncbi:hypothetical protein KC19_5G149400 [Ceratodon purpureus]|uniref:Uncharacterized protein n=1 Tax=Ceratodon purpureus TaxID=3225 RepID=A0A8T0I322_CERPU|nr:hypothetical protein KC19_5G149400 [Ceratodon purpureus]